MNETGSFHLQLGVHDTKRTATRISKICYIIVLNGYGMTTAHKVGWNIKPVTINATTLVGTGVPSTDGKSHAMRLTNPTARLDSSSSPVYMLQTTNSP